MERERSAASGATSARRGALLSVHDSAPAGKRTTLDILLLDAEYRQTLAALRAYTRMGLSVGVVACAEEASGAPAFASRYARVRAVVPDFATDPDGYVDALLELLELYPARMILPAHDGSIEALRPRRAEIERLTTLPLASEAALDIAISKPRTLEVAEEMGVAIPRSLPVTTLDEARAAFRAFGPPTVLKPVQSWAENETGGTRLSVNAVLTEEDAEREARYILESGGQAVAQEFLPGWREAVSVFYADGQIPGALRAAVVPRVSRARRCLHALREHRASAGAGRASRASRARDRSRRLLDGRVSPRPRGQTCSHGDQRAPGWLAGAGGALRRQLLAVAL